MKGWEEAVKVFVIVNRDGLLLGVKSTLELAKTACYLLECNQLCRGYQGIETMEAMFWVEGYHEWSAYNQSAVKHHITNTYGYKNFRYQIREYDLSNETNIGYFAQQGWMEQTAQELGLPIQSEWMIDNAD
jgi:hypothetical protein